MSSPGLFAEEMQEAVASLSTPDVLDTPFGRMEFFDGVPKADTVASMYDALDLMRGVEVFMNSVPGASLVAMRRGISSVGVDSPRRTATPIRVRTRVRSFSRRTPRRPMARRSSI